MTRHSWTADDDIVALYLYRFDDDDLPFTTDRIGQLLGMGASSLRCRIMNFQALDDDGGLNNWAAQSEQVYDEHSETAQDDLHNLVCDILDKAKAQDDADRAARREKWKAFVRGLNDAAFSLANRLIGRRRSD